MTVARQRMAQGQMAHHAGTAAEAAVARHYQSLGFDVVAERWRGAGGEIDLIVQNADRVVFVEVKKSKSFDAAARSLSPKQMARIYATAEEYLGCLPTGSLTEARFDVALMDSSGAVRIIANAFGAA